MKNKIYIITLISLIIDQTIKYIIKINLDLGQVIHVINNFFSITYLKNTGAAFSILEDKSFILVIISFILFICIIKYIEKEKNLTLFSCISLGLLLGGIMGNLIDRILYSYVIDFLSFKFFNYYFPVFNCADVFIVLGVIFLIIETIIIEFKQKGGKHENRRRKHKQKT